MTNKFSMKFLVLTLLCLAFGIGQVVAQSSVTGGIRGKITDPQGAVIPNASVTITNLGTNKVATVTTSGDGEYRVTNLEPGTYSVQSTSGNFTPAKAERVIVEVGRETSLDLALSVNGTSAQVEVTAESPVINTNDMANATNIDQTQISELPINGRRASDFARLTPGVNPEQLSRTLIALEQPHARRYR